MPNLTFDNEKELLLHVTLGNESAFRNLFALYHQQLGKYIFQLTENMELAEEVVQDVFLKIWIKREALADVQNFKAYLFVISKNHALNCLKKQAKEWLQEKELQRPDYTSFIVDENENPYYNWLDEAIDQLPPQQQKVYLLSRHERLKYAEIAIHLNLSKDTVKKYLQIANNSIMVYMYSKLVPPVVILLLLVIFF
jgi:RNA polymerase sigma-70 factor (family 1)